MKKIILLLYFTTFLFSFEITPITSTIVSITKNRAKIDKEIEKGVSGYIIDKNQIIGKVISNGDKSVTFLPFTKLKNSGLATPIIIPKIGNKIIFKLYYDRALIIAPTQNLYLKTKKNYPNINFLSSDLFASYFATKPNKKEFQQFCKTFNVGIIIFNLDRQFIVDCESFQILDSKFIKSEKFSKPFFVNYDKFNTTLFRTEPNNWIKYYNSILKESNE